MAEVKKEDKPKRSLSEAAKEFIMGAKVSSDATEAEMTNKLESMKEGGTAEQIAAIEKQIADAKKKKDANKGEGAKALEQ